MILAFDTATKYCSVALETPEGILELNDPAPNGHAAQLMPMIDRLFQQAKIKPQALEAIVVSLGPGSFTGIRIGISTALGLASSLAIPVYGVSSLRARSFLNAKTICPIIDARRDRVYAACYGQLNLAESNLAFEELIDDIAGQEVVFTGEDIESFAERTGVKTLSSNDYARGLILAYHLGDYTSDVTPRYLRMSQAEAEVQGILLP